MKSKGIEELPPPNLQGNYQGSCVVCLHGTDTALAFVGEAEWLVAGLDVLGIPDDEADIMVAEFFEGKGADPGKVLDGEHKMAVQVCAGCVAKAKPNFPAPGIPAFGVPDIRQIPWSHRS